MKQELDCPFDFTSRCTMGRCDCKPKQETLEEAAESYLDSPLPHSYKLAVEFGTKWQQERSYSEEEVIELLQKALTHQDDGETGSLVTAQGEIRPPNFYSWFERFKKK